VKNKFRLVAAVICNLTSAVLTAVSILHFFVTGGEGNMAVLGVTCFRYFTVDSNLLAALGCCALLPYQLLQLTGKRQLSLPRWTVLLKFIGTAAVTVTLLTVLFYLAPSIGFAELFLGDNLYMHLITPVLCLLSCCVLENEIRLPLWQSLAGMLPSLIYGSFYLVQVVFCQIWPDFYMFNIDGRWYLTVALSLPLTAALCIGLTALRNRLSQK